MKHFKINAIMTLISTLALGMILTFGCLGVSAAQAADLGDVVINEIMQNPSRVSDENGEWFELFNPTTADIDINGWTIQDNDFDSHEIKNGGPLIIPAGGFLVLGINADPATNGGAPVCYQYSNFLLGNSSDEVILLDENTIEIDRVEYDNGTTFPDPNGASMFLTNPALDNNIGANWNTSATSFGDGDFGTPQTSICTGVVINEVDADTPSTDEEEFVELYDGGFGNTSLDGLVLVFYNGNGDVSYAAFDLDGFSTDANGYFVLGNSSVSPDLVFPGNTLQNGADAVALYVGDASDFPNGTAVTTTNPNPIDALVYDTNDADDPDLLVLLNSEQQQINEDGGGDKDNHSNSRCPNGSGGRRNTFTYLQTTPTPGADNNCLQNAAPDCSEAEPSIATLWPVNHKFIMVDVLGVTDPDGDEVTITIDSIVQDEPVDSTGDGSFIPDGSGVGTPTASVRAERDGSGNGRVYHIRFTAEDENGAACSGEVLVGVPKSKGKKGAPVDDDWWLYDSTAE